MASTKKTRKPYNPNKWAAGATPMTIRNNEETELAMIYIPHVELTKYEINQPTQESWHTIVARLNVGQILAFRHFKEPEVAALCREALDCMVAVNQRKEQIGLDSMKKEEVSVVGFALSFVDRMQRETTRREFASALERVYDVAAIKPTQKGKKK